MSLRFINTNPLTREFEKVELSDGDWVLLKKELTNHEDRHVSIAALGNMKGELGKLENEIGVDWDAFEFERVFTWLHGWSSKVQLNRENLRNLSKEDFDEIKAKLDKYLSGREKEKNGAPSPSGSPPQKEDEAIISAV